jgi:hypothetical protein
VIALLLAAFLLVQDPASPAAQEPGPPASEEPAPARAPDAIELPPPVKGDRKAAERAPGATPERQRADQTKRSSPGRPDCRNLNYADANPETCGAAVIGEPVADDAPPSRPLPAATPPEKAPATQPGKVAEKGVDVRAYQLRIAAIVAAALLLISALFALLLRARGTSSDGVREVELQGPDRMVLSPAALARGTQGPGKSRWSVRDGRLILTGPAGTLLNGVRLDRAGDIVSTGDTVRLGGAEYRVRIV